MKNYFASHSGNRPYYRSRNGWVLGVCQGLADYTDIPPWLVRLAVVITLLATGIFPIVVIYIVAGMIMKPAPMVKPSTQADWEFYNSFSASRGLALDRLKRRFEQLERRTRRIEDRITNREFDWERRFRMSQ